MVMLLLDLSKLALIMGRLSYWTLSNRQRRMMLSNRQRRMMLSNRQRRMMLSIM